MTAGHRREHAHTRRALLTRAGKGIAGLIGLSAVLPRTIGAATDRRSRAFEVDFSKVSNRRGWGRLWFSHLYRRTWDVRSGRARFKVPDGLASTAPTQPMPIFLFDHECRDCTQELTFHVSDLSLRPGLLFQSKGPLSYHAVTVEDRHLVLSRYGRTRREVLVRARVPSLRAGQKCSLEVAVTGRSVTARVWRTDRPRPPWQLAGRSKVARVGTPGVLVVHPENLLRSSLVVHRYRLSSPKEFEPTTPYPTYVLAGIPQGNGTTETRLRCASAYPAEIAFEWSSDPTFTSGVTRSTAAAATTPPFTAAIDVPVNRNSTLHWRAVLTSLSSGAVAKSAVQTIRPFNPSQGVTLGAASCAQLWGKPAYTGLQGLRDAAGGELDAFVYQGDLGYAQNSYRSCYRLAQDFFADRFTRFLADPHFTSLRASTPTGFTIDDHDYGSNNGHAAGNLPWTIPLWNSFHADPTDTGYFDFRLGDVHCLTLDGRRYSDKQGTGGTKLGPTQLSWLQDTIAASNATAFVILSADIFASRNHSLDCFLFGFPDEYEAVMTTFMDAQLDDKRVVIMSGDAHGMRIHYHPDPAARPQAAGLSVIEFICSGLEARTWNGASQDDPTLDPERNVLGQSGAGLIEIGPPADAARTITLRAIGSDENVPDLFPPLTVSYRPTVATATIPGPTPAKPRIVRRAQPE